MTISRNILDQILHLHNENLSSIKISEKIGLSPQTVTKYLRENNISVSRNTRLKLSDKEIALMRRMKINGYKLADIADKFKVSRTTVSLHTLYCTSLSRQIF